MKRGQITAFIVIGILILFAVGFILYAATLRGGLRVTAKETAIEQYLGNCIEQVGEQGIRALGLTGGYLEVPENVKLNERSYFSFVPRTEPKIPLWYYRGQPRIPTKQFMEQQIAEYTINNIGSCIGEFDPFKDQYELQLTSNVTAEAIVGENAVTIKLNYPLEAKNVVTGDIQRTESISRPLDVALGRIYDSAVDILRQENRGLFFENLTLDLLSTNPDFPFTGFDFDCAPKTWRRSDLTGFARDMLSSNLNRVTVQGNPITLYDSSNQFEKKNYVFPVEKPYSGLSVSFLYPRSARFDMSVNPNNNEVMKSNVGRASSLISFFCLNGYHFTYDIEYPLLTTIRENKAFSGRGFVFNFAFPVTIDNNNGDKSDIPINVFETNDPITDFCEDVAEQQVDVRTVNAFTFEEINRVNVTYKCVKSACDLGATSSEGGAYRILTQLPASCTGGLLQAAKPGYLDGQATYDGGNFAEVPMKPLKAFKISFTKHDSTDFSRTEPLEEGDIVTLVITSSSDPSFEQVFISDSDVTEIPLIEGPASYKVELLYVKNDILRGGYIGEWEPQFSDLFDKDEVVFHLIQYIPVPVNDELQAEAAQYLFDSTAYQQPLRPTFR